MFGLGRAEFGISYIDVRKNSEQRLSWKGPVLHGLRERVRAEPLSEEKGTMSDDRTTVVETTPAHSGALLGAIAIAVLAALGGLVWSYALSNRITHQEAALSEANQQNAKLAGELRETNARLARGDRRARQKCRHDAEADGRACAGDHAPAKRPITNGWKRRKRKPRSR